MTEEEKDELVYEQTNLRVALLTCGHPWMLGKKAHKQIEDEIRNELNFGRVLPVKVWYKTFKRTHK